MDFSKWALDNRKLVNFLVLCMMIGGVFSYDSMSKLEDPAIKVKQAMVVTTYPGASARQVELEVTDLLEKSIREMPGINAVQSYSYNDLSIINVELLTTVSDDEVEQKWDMLRRKVSNVQGQLPAGATASSVMDDFGDVYGMFYALTGDDFDYDMLSDYAELIKQEVADIDGVTRVEIYGKRNECIHIDMQQDRMANMGVMPTEVIQTISNQNKTTYSGYYNNGTSRVRVTVNDRFNNVDDIGNMLLQGHGNEQLRIKDIAHVHMAYEEPARNTMTRDGQKALGISIACSPDYDIIKVGKKVEKCIAELKTRIPLGIECEKVFFQPERVDDALSTFIVNLIESVLIVILVLIFTMGLKSGLIIGMSLMVIVLGSFTVLNIFDGTLQRVSLGAFILAMGMLVDNAIVIVDGILIDLKLGKPRLAALTDIARKTAMPLLGATLIAILAFLPIYLSPDTAGVYVRDLFIVIAVSLLLSWLLAITHVPIMADSMLYSSKKNDKSADLYTGRTYRILERILNFGLNHRITVVASAVVLVAVSAYCYRYLKQGFFPDMEYNQLYMEYKLPEGVNYTQVDKDLKEIQTLLRQRKEITHITASTGGTPSRYNLVRSIASPSLAYGELIIDFESPEALVENIDVIQDELSRRYPDAYIKLKRYNLMFKKYPIEACFHGPDPEVLHRLCDSAMAIVRRNEKVYLPTSDWEPLTPVLTINYDQSSARSSGISRNDVSMSVLAYTGGIPIGQFYDGITRQNIYIRCTDNDGTDIDRIENISLFSLLPNLSSVANRETLRKLMSGTINKEELISTMMMDTPLKQVAHGVDIKWEEPVVVRHNGQRTQRVQCSSRPGYGVEEARQSIAKEIEAIPLPAGYSLSWDGEKKASDQSTQHLFANFPLSIILMIGILIMLFKDYKKPLVIFCCIPMILIGVIPAVLLTGKAFGFVAIVGVLGLIGMMIKNGIVLIDEITLQLENGVRLRPALIESSKSRLRPVMMASLTTILGMIPLVNDALFGSLAVTIMGGLFVGTIITLIIIPVLYSLFKKPYFMTLLRAKFVKMMNSKAKVIVLLFLATGTSSALAQTDSLTIEDCRRMALENNSRISAARHTQNQYHYEAKAMKSNFFPKLNILVSDFYSSASGSFTIEGGNLPIYKFDATSGSYLPSVMMGPNGQPTLSEYALFPDQKLDLKVKNVLMGVLTLEQPLYTGGKVSTAYKMAQLGDEMSRHNLRLTQTEVLVEADKAYAACVRTELLTKAAQSYLATLNELYRTVESAVRNGMATRNDLLKVQVKQNEAELALQQATNARQLALMNLRHVIGSEEPLARRSQLDVRNLPFNNTSMLSDTLLPIGSAEIKNPHSSRPEQAILSAQTQLSELNVKLVKSDYLPQLMLSGSVGYTNGMEMNGKKLFDGASYGAALVLKVPVSLFGEAQSKARAARARHLAAVDNELHSNQQMQLEVAQCRNTYAEAQTRVQLTQRSLAQAEENMRMSRQRYEVGAELLSDLLEAQTLWHNAYAALAEARCNLIISHTMLLKATGQLDVEAMVIR